ncbi:MAG: ATP-binding protein, partial [Cyanobacteria bacterium J06636_16]
ALLLDYCVAVLQRLRKANQRLVLANAELVRADQAKDQLLAARQQAETQLHQTNQKLTRITRLKDEFLASMSHEFRTPLNAILSITEGLQGGIYGTIDSAQVGALQTIERSGFHLLELINDILDVAQIESGQIRLNRTPTAITALCKSSLALVEPLAAKKNIRLQLTVPNQLPRVWLDERRMRQVLLNLLNNAIKFTPEGGCVILEAHCRESAPMGPTPGNAAQGTLRITVTDTGIGIPQHHIQKLFQPFVQVENALNRQSSGTGLGLALVKRIVDLHGGQVRIVSQVGLGSCFTVELPCTRAIAAPAQTGPPHVNALESNLPPPSAYPLILLAEDDEATVKTVSTYLSAKGYRIVIAKTGQTAVSLAQSEHPNLVLMDVQMPGIDGLEATRQIRCDPTLMDVPIVAVTALAMSGDRERCLTAGANAYLSKPIKLQKLVSTIQQLLAVNRPQSH